MVQLRPTNDQTDKALAVFQQCALAALLGLGLMAGLTAGPTPDPPQHSLHLRVATTAESVRHLLEMTRDRQARP